MGRLLSIIAGIYVGWKGPDRVMSAAAEVILFALVITLIAITFWLKGQLRPSPDSALEAIAPMPLALYIPACKAVWHGELVWPDLVLEGGRIFVLSSVFVGVVAALTRLVQSLLL